MEGMRKGGKPRETVEKGKNKRGEEVRAKAVEMEKNR